MQNALSYVRGIVLDKKLAAQLAPYANAVETLSDTLRSLECWSWMSARHPTHSNLAGDVNGLVASTKNNAKYLTSVVPLFINCITVSAPWPARA